MTYSFDTELACKYGVEEAILLNHIAYWINHNRIEGRNLYDGRTWTYNTYAKFAAHFPFWDERKVRRLIDNLVNKKLLIKGNYNKDSRDNTNWYALVDEDAIIGTCFRKKSEEIVQKAPSFQSAENGRPLAENGRALPNNNYQIDNKEERESTAQAPMSQKGVKKKNKTGGTLLIHATKVGYQDPENPTPEEVAHNVAVYLHSQLRPIYSDSSGWLHLKSLREATLEDWVVEASRMIRLDKRPREQIKLIIDFLIEDEFWKFTVRSMAGLREKYDSILSQYLKKVKTGR